MRTLLGSTSFLFVLGCGAGPNARPVAPFARPNAETLERFSRMDDEPGVPAVAILADPSAAPPQISAVGPEVLTFDAVMQSVEEQFPLILAAFEEVQIAAAELLRAEGGFDLNVKAGALAGLQGFYENETAKAVIEQPTTAWGATVFGGYKRGTGDFPIWEGGLKTRDDGEFSAGVRVPLLKGREIDQRRLQLWQARIGQAQADPIVLQKRLEATEKAALSYWKWVAAGQRLSIARRLFGLAESRQSGIADSVNEGELPELANVENQRLIVERRSIVIRAERDLQQAAISLSLFWRGPDGAPIIPPDSSLPGSLPQATDPERLLSAGDVELALRNRPEIRAIQLEMSSLGLDVQKAENDLLPKLDLTVAGSKDVGDRVSTPDDKGPFEFDVLLGFDVPVQRRAASGKIRSLKSKSVQLDRKLQFAVESVIAEVQDVQSAVRQTWLRLAQVEENAALAARLEEAERDFLIEGQSDLFRVNLREQQTASAASMLVDVTAEHFRALAEYRATIGVPYDEVVR